MKNIGIIGTGNIGTQLLKLMCRNNAQNHLTISDKMFDKGQHYAKRFDVEANTNKETIEMSDILFLTVKPDQIKSICKEINTYTQEGKNKKNTIVSVAAGVNVDQINDWTLNQHRVLRCMPNIPISISEGSILWYSRPDYATHHSDDKYILDEITEGPHSMWVQDEELIDAGTILSGCSPAYLAKIYQIYVDMGKELGFSQAQSRKLLHNSFAGTIKMLLNNSPAHIMKQVASKGGATEKSLEVLDQEGLRDIIKRSIEYSMDRIRDLREKV